MKDNALATVVLVGLVGFLYPLYDLLNHIENWEVIDQPHGVAQLIWCVICALIAVGAAMGINLKQFLSPIVSFANNDNVHVSDMKRLEIISMNNSMNNKDKDTGASV